MILRLNVLLKGASGVRIELCDHSHLFIKENIYPIIPEYGSVGASRDLCPLAHLALPLLGLGFVHSENGPIEAASVLEKKQITPIVLMEKEGLILINGTQIMTSIGALSL